LIRIARSNPLASAASGSAERSAARRSTCSLPAQAGEELAGRGHPHPVAAFAEIGGQRRDEAQPPAGFRHMST
jgi:hypothetical protein